jgi:signal transduction histidine kinase
MKPYSITRRLVTTVLLVELLLTGCETGVALYYERNQQFRAFDVMLHGRADSVFAAVQDAEDAEDNVVLQASSLDLPPSDLYEVRDESSGRIIGHSSNWMGVPNSESETGKPIHDFQANGRRYRGIVMHSVRVVDAEGNGPGIARKVIVFYASPTRRIWWELWEAARFLTLFNSLLLLVTGVVLILLLRRSMAPLNALAVQAAEVSAKSWKFEAPPEARAARELTALVNALEAVLRRLERSFSQQRNFVNDAAHELKTAVTVIKSSLQLVDYKERTIQEYQSGLSLCLSDCERMEDLVHRLLTLAQADQIASDLNQTAAILPTDIAECLREVIGQLESVAQMRKVLVVSLLPDSLIAKVAAEDFMSLATNLILNAIQHSADGARVRVAARPDPAVGIRITIQDEGEGIPAEHLPFVFERFYRGDASRSRQTGGTGLGLAICQAIVEAYGGHIAIESEEQKGTIVSVDLPALPVASSTSMISLAEN